jgi:small ligand-binding sensory domain FIST
MPYASSLSTHDDPAIAVAEAIGHILDKLGPSPDFAVVFVSGHFKNRVGDIRSAVAELLRPNVLIGCTAGAVVCGSKEIEDQSALAIFGGSCDGEVVPLRIDNGSDLLHDTREPLADTDIHTMLLLADPFSFPAETALAQCRSLYPKVQIIGGLVSSTDPSSGDCLLLDGEIYRDGAVALLIKGEVVVEPLVSQGCRPVGSPLIITRSRDNMIYELGGRPALQRLEEMIEVMPEKEKMLVNHGLHVGRVIDEHKLEFSRGDFLIRAVIGADRDSGVVAIGDLAPVGSTIQFQVRDASSATEDLTQLSSRIPMADGALLFTCNGRGTNLFEAPNHDASEVAARIKGEAVAGMFCAGEIGPVSEQSFLHGFTASAAVFRD